MLYLENTTLNIAVHRSISFSFLKHLTMKNSVLKINKKHVCIYKQPPPLSFMQKLREEEKNLTDGNLQNWDMGASSCGAVLPLELSFWTWVGGTGLWDWPVALYMACTHSIRSCSSSLAKITVSPSFTALKNVRPPSRPERPTQKATLCLCTNKICVCTVYTDSPKLFKANFKASKISP